MSFEGKRAQQRVHQMALSNAAEPLPATREELMARLKTKEDRTLNDYVYDIVLAIFDRPEFQKFWAATYDVAAVEGDLKLEDGKMAEQIKAYAVDHKIERVLPEKTYTIVKSMNVVLRKFDLDRKSRRLAVHVAIPPASSHQGE